MVRGLIIFSTCVHAEVAVEHDWVWGGCMLTSPPPPSFRFTWYAVSGFPSLSCPYGRRCNSLTSLQSGWCIHVQSVLYLESHYKPISISEVYLWDVLTNQSMSSRLKSITTCMQYTASSITFSLFCSVHVNHKVNFLFIPQFGTTDYQTHLHSPSS